MGRVKKSKNAHPHKKRCYFVGTFTFQVYPHKFLEVFLFQNCFTCRNERIKEQQGNAAMRSSIITRGSRWHHLRWDLKSGIDLTLGIDYNTGQAFRSYKKNSLSNQNCAQNLIPWLMFYGKCMEESILAVCLIMNSKFLQGLLLKTSSV